MPAYDKNIASVKDVAEKYFSRGRLKEALGEYESIISYSSKDPRIPLRIGDIYRKMDKNDEAINAYKLAVDTFISQGFIAKAIGVCKVIIDMDPSQTHVQEKIAELYAKRGLTVEGQKKSETAGSVKREDEKTAKLPRTPLFSDLTRDELLALIDKMKHHIISPGVFIFNEGDNGDSLYIINSGTVDIISRDKKGDTVILSALKEGDFFGEFGFFSNVGRGASVRASSPVTLLEIVKSDVNDIIKKHKRVAQVLFEFYKERVVDRLMALSPIFEPMTPADRKAVLARLTSRKFEKDETIVRQGESGDTMYLIKEGKVRVWIEDREKGKISVADLEEGDFFGEIALATSRPRLANVTAVTNSELILFSRPMIKDILTKYPQIKGILEKIIKTRVADVQKVKGLQSAALV